MFNKPFKIKQNSQLKGTEMRKIRSEILKSFPQLGEDELMDLIPQKEIVSSTKLVTHSGETVIVFSVQKLPIVFMFEKVFYPTVYMLWKFPDLLPVFTTWPQVLPKLRGGADLMLPGIVLREEGNLHAYGKLEKGARVAINVTSNKAPAAVGVTALSSFDMYMAAKRGKAVKIHHITGDHLWALGTTLTIPELGPTQDPEIVGENMEEVKEEATIHSINAAQIANKSEIAESGMHSSCSSVVEITEETIVSHLVEPFGNLSVGETLEEGEESSSLVTSLTSKGDDTIKEMDELLLYCFLKAWKTSAKISEFPVLTSNFYRLHILPACPVGKSVDLKRSSYKKLSKFLNAMQDTGIIKLKQLTKGVESIMSVDYEHSMLKEFVDTNLTVETASKEEDISNKFIKPEIVEMRTVTAAVLPVLSCYDCKKGDNIPVADVRKRVTDYVKANNLQSSSDKNVVNLDPVLKTVLQRPDADSLDWEHLMSTFLDRMSPSYQISCGESTVISKGKLKAIDMQVERRAGNKKVTLVNNLELYKINVQEFAKECQHGAAASTSINTIAGSKSRQILIQGNHVLFVAHLLTEKYKIPMQHIRGLQYAPKSKK